MKQKDNRKVIIIGGGPPPYGGGEEMMQLLIDEVPKRSGFQVILLNTRDPRGTANRGKIDLLNLYLGLLHLVKLFGLLIVHRPDLVYLSISRNTFVAFARDALFIHLSSWFGARVVGHLHGSYFDELYQNQNRLGQWFIRKTMVRVSNTIILGETLRFNFDPFMPNNRIHVVYNGIVGTPYWKLRKKYLLEKADNGKSPFKVLFVGVLKKTKGYHVLLQALPKIVSRRSDIKIQLAGEWFTPAEKEESLAFVERHQLGNYVEFLGIIRGEQKYHHFADADLFAFPTSYIEGHPIVIVEAMASGLPVISTNRGSIPEYVIDNRTGFIIPENDPEALADKILELMENPELGQEIGLQSRAMFEDRFTEAHFVDGVIKVWRQALNGHDTATGAR